MRQVARIDGDGFYVEPVVIKDSDDLPDGCVDTLPQAGLYKAKYIDSAWAEGLTPEEIAALLGAPQPESELDELKRKQELMQQALDDLILGGAI